MLHLPRQSYSLYEKEARASSVSQRSHSATYTHLSDTALCTNSSGTCILTQEKHNPHFSMHIPLKSLILPVVHTHTHKYKHMAVSQVCRDGTTSISLLSVVVVLQSKTAKHFLLSLPFLLCSTLINILYGFCMDLFSFLLLSPRGATATFSCLFNDCG